MARGPRIQYEGAIYHVINRGNYKFDVFDTDGAKQAFEACLWEGCKRAEWALHAYAVMKNHFHFAVETPRPNLSTGMQWLESTFASRFNRYRGEHGHLFQGRYKALLVEPGPSLARVVHYIHLNPVRAGITSVERLEDYVWSSYPQFRRPLRSPLLSCGRWLSELGIADTVEGWLAYARYLEWRAGDDDLRKRDEKELTRGWAIGSPAWKKLIATEYRTLLGRHRLRGQELRELRELEWNAKFDQLVSELGISLETALLQPKSAPWKIQLAHQLRAATSATNGWIAGKLRMGSSDSLSSLLSRMRAG